MANPSLFSSRRMTRWLASSLSVFLQQRVLNLRLPSFYISRHVSISVSLPSLAPTFHLALLPPSLILLSRLSPSPPVLLSPPSSRHKSTPPYPPLPSLSIQLYYLLLPTSRQPTAFPRVGCSSVSEPRSGGCSERA